MTGNQNSGMPPVSQQRDEELYAQIAAGDEVEIKNMRKKSSLIMSLMIEYMRLTLFLDEKRRKYIKVFRFFGGIWALLMILLYLCGLVMLCILIVSYMCFPTRIQEYLRENGITYEKMEIPGYIVSQIDLYNLQDKNKTYQIEKLSVSSTFADFLNKRARSVSAKGVRILLDKDQKQSGNILTALARLNRQGGEGRGLRIDSVEVSDAMLTFKGKDYTIPVSLSMTGVYGRETNLSAFLSVNEPNLKIQGPLSVRNNDQGMRWDLNIQSGQIAFPGRPLEKINGQISVQMKHVQLHSVTTDLLVNSDRLGKKVNLFLERKNDRFSGKLSLKFLDTVNPLKPVEKTKLDFDLNSLAFLPDGIMKTDKPLRVNFSSTYNPDYQVQSMTAVLTGELSCRGLDSCHYQLNKASPITFEDVALKDQGYTVRNSGPVRVFLEPNRNLFDISFKTGLSQFNLKSKNLKIVGRQTETKGKVTLTASEAWIRGRFNIWNKDIFANASVSDLTYVNPSVELKKGTFVSHDIFGGSDQTRLSGNLWLKNNSYFKTPFDLTYSHNNDFSSIALSMEKDQIKLFFDGDFNLTTGGINGRLVVPSINLGKLSQPLSRISDLFPEELKSITGEVSAFGRLSGNIYTRLRGPLYIALSNINILTEKLDVRHLSTVLFAQSVYPFVTEPNQRLYIGLINSFLPISDVEVTLKAEENYAQLRHVFARVGGMDLYAGETLIPYQTVGTLIYLRNRSGDLSDAIKNLQLKDWQLSGNVKGNILLPLEVKDTSLNVKNASLQVSGGNVKYVGPAVNKPMFLGKNSQFVVQSGNISIDGDTKTVGNVKVSIVMDALFGPTSLKKVIRETFTGRFADMVRSITPSAFKVPEDISAGIRHIQAQTKKFRRK